MNYLVLGLVFAAVVMAVFAIAQMLQPKMDLSKRIDPNARPETPEKGKSKTAQSLRVDANASTWAKLVAAVEERGLSLEDSQAEILTDRLALAGYTASYAVRAYVLIRTVLTLSLPILTYLLLVTMGISTSNNSFIFYLLLSAAAGLYVPQIIVSSKADARKQSILNGFPDALDLMLVCVEAGLGVDACFTRVGQEMADLHPDLAELFAAVSWELRAGRPRAEALRNMAKRSGVDEIKSFATLIVQSDKLGASIAHALKIYAAEMRESRRMRAEEKAHRLPVLLSIPLVLFLLPTMVGVLALPAIISMRSSLF